MKSFFCKSLIFFLAMTLTLSPRMVSMAFAQDDQDSVSDEEIKAIQRLAKAGYLGDKRDFFLSAKKLTDDDITDGLLKINDQLSRVDLKSLRPGDKTYRLEDLQVLLTLVKDGAEDIRARKVSAWKFEKKVEKIIAYMSESKKPEPAAVDGETAPKEKAGDAADESEKAAPAPKPTPVPTPIPGPNREEWDQLKGDIKDLLKKAGDFQEIYDKKIEALQKSDDEIKAANGEIKTSNGENQEQLKLVKRLLDRVQDDLKKTDEKLDQVSQKASEKSMTDVELQQELSIMHKDLRDNSQDVSILKQEVKKLDKTEAAEGQSPLDQALGSKWLAGGALLVGLAALVVTLTKK